MEKMIGLSDKDGFSIQLASTPYTSNVTNFQRPQREYKPTGLHGYKLVVIYVYQVWWPRICIG